MRISHVLGCLAVVGTPGFGLGQEPAAAPAPDHVSPRVAVESVLDGFHRAASEADGETYFGLFDSEGVFLGTDATERWTVDEFRAYARPHFDRGRGWTYTPLERHVSISDDGTTAWFDERLYNEGLGETRGSGVLVRRDGTWKVVQYNLTIPVPNELAAEVVERIRTLEAGRGEGGAAGHE